MLLCRIVGKSARLVVFAFRNVRSEKKCNVPALFSQIWMKARPSKFQYLMMSLKRHF